MKEIVPINLGNGILLFKNVLKDKEKVYNFIKESKKNNDKYFGKNIWKDWSPWGNYAKAYPMIDESYLDSTEYGAELQKEGLEIFFNVLKIYKENFLDNKYFDRHGYSKDLPTNMQELKKSKYYKMADFVIFETNRNTEPHAQMEWHQDVVYHWGKQNHILNFNIYVNDDYDGGEIVFFKHNEVESVDYTDCVTGEKGKCLLVEDYFEYKMESGDGMIFDTEIYHAVNKLGENQSKYYIRQFLTHDFSQKYYDSMKVDPVETENQIKKEMDYLKLHRLTPKVFKDINSITLSSIDKNYRSNFFPVIIK